MAVAGGVVQAAPDVRVLLRCESRLNIDTLKLAAAVRALSPTAGLNVAAAAACGERYAA